MHDFIQIVTRHYGQKPVIYTTIDFFRDNDLGQLPSAEYWLRSVSAHPSAHYSDQAWKFWQYTGTGKIPGVRGQTDIKVFNGTFNAKQREDRLDWLKAEVDEDTCRILTGDPESLVVVPFETTGDLVATFGSCEEANIGHLEKLREAGYVSPEDIGLKVTLKGLAVLRPRFKDVKRYEKARTIFLGQQLTFDLPSPDRTHSGKR